MSQLGALLAKYQLGVFLAKIIVFTHSQYLPSPTHKNSGDFCCFSITVLVKAVVGECRCEIQICVHECICLPKTKGL